MNKENICSFDLVDSDIARGVIGECVGAETCSDQCRSFQEKDVCEEAAVIGFVIAGGEVHEVAGVHGRDFLKVEFPVIDAFGVFVMDKNACVFIKTLISNVIYPSLAAVGIKGSNRNQVGIMILVECIEENGQVTSFERATFGIGIDRLGSEILPRNLGDFSRSFLLIIGRIFFHLKPACIVIFMRSRSVPGHSFNRKLLMCNDM